jgi:hypothetical protein
MTTLLGPVPCRECRTTVWVVRRTAEVPCMRLDLYAAIRLGRRYGKPIDRQRHTHAISDIGPATVVEANGTTHLCRVAA